MAPVVSEHFYIAVYVAVDTLFINAVWLLLRANIFYIAVYVAVDTLFINAVWFLLEWANGRNLVHCRI